MFQKGNDSFHSSTLKPSIYALIYDRFSVPVFDLWNEVLYNTIWDVLWIPNNAWSVDNSFEWPSQPTALHPSLGCWAERFSPVARCQTKVTGLVPSVSCWTFGTGIGDFTYSKPWKWTLSSPPSPSLCVEHHVTVLSWSKSFKSHSRSSTTVLHGVHPCLHVACLFPVPFYNLVIFLLDIMSTLYYHTIYYLWGLTGVG